MTCEVLLMNKHAAVMAADSAMTISSGGGSKYVKGVNKIFSLLDHQPVGVMVYGAASFMGVPWDLIFKEYRTNTRNKRFKTVDDIASDFKGWIISSPPVSKAGLNPDEYAKSVIFDLVMVLEEICFREACKSQSHNTNYSEMQENLNSEMLRIVEAQQDYIRSILPCLSIFDESSANRLKEMVLSGFNGELDSVKTKYLDVAVEAYMRGVNIPEAGIVICGFGDNEYFPVMKSLSLYGLYSGSLMYRDVAKTAIAQNNPSFLESFAINESINTFMYGMSDSVLKSVMQACRETLQNLNIADIDAACKDFSNRVIDRVSLGGTSEIKSSIASMPIQEMCSFAETLINLESVRERVTSPSESVGGPVDIAAITRGEGLIWIKRKHYFDADLNLRYNLRVGRSFQAESQRNERE